MKTKQSGITLIGFLILLIVFGFFAFMAMKLVPAYIEYAGVVKAMNQISSGGVDGKSVQEIRAELMFKMNFQYVDDAAVKPTDINVIQGDGGTQLNVNYDKDIPFLYNIDFLVHFDKSVPLQGNLAAPQ